MPSYTGTLSPQEIADIVSYLSSLRGHVMRRARPSSRCVVARPRRAARRRRSPSTASCSGDSEPHNWLSYSGTLKNQRYSPLTQITTANVKNLQQAVDLAGAVAREVRGDAAGRRRRHVHRQAPNNVVALDAVTGPPVLDLSPTRRRRRARRAAAASTAAWRSSATRCTWARSTRYLDRDRREERQAAAGTPRWPTREGRLLDHVAARPS